MTIKLKLVPWARKNTPIGVNAAAVRLTKAQVTQITKQIGFEQAARYIDSHRIALVYP